MLEANTDWVLCPALLLRYTELQCGEGQRRVWGLMFRTLKLQILAIYLMLQILHLQGGTAVWIGWDMAGIRPGPKQVLSTQSLSLLPFLFLSCPGLPQGPSLHPWFGLFVFHFLWLHFLCKHTLFIYIRHEYPVITAAIPPEYLLETFWTRWSPKGPKQPFWYQIIKWYVVYQMSGWHWQGTSHASHRWCFTLPWGIIMILPIAGLGRMPICCTRLLTDWWIFLDFIDNLWSRGQLFQLSSRPLTSFDRVAVSTNWKTTMKWISYSSSWLSSRKIFCLYVFSFYHSLSFYDG